jgi:UDPglucose 6-dehydrogenase
MKISIIGTGYVGLVTAACLASTHKVYCYDINQEKIDSLNAWKIHFYEKGLKDLVLKYLNKSLFFSNDLKQVLNNSTACMIAVNTPFDKKKNENDLSFYYNAIDNIISSIDKKQKLLLINKSTLEIGTANNVKDYVANKAKDLAVNFVVNPEFLSQGNAVDDCFRPERIVIGISNQEDRLVMDEIYKDYIKKKVKIIYTDINSAELIKYAANSILATKVAFINEIAEISGKINANINDISYAVGLDKRIGDKFLESGPGYGGSCFPKDTRSLSYCSKKLGLDLKIINNIDLSNEDRMKSIANKILQILKGKNIQKIAIIGVTFKQGTDDLRDSQTSKIINLLHEEDDELSYFIYDVLLERVKNVNLPNSVLVSSIKGLESEVEAYIVFNKDSKYNELENIVNKDDIVIDLRNNLKRENYKNKLFYKLGHNL